MLFTADQGQQVQIQRRGALGVLRLVFADDHRYIHYPAAARRADVRRRRYPVPDAAVVDDEVAGLGFYQYFFIVLVIVEVVFFTEEQVPQSLFVCAR